MALELLHLPTEILVRIFESLGNESLYHLATLSRRLHFVALPIYFSRTKVNLGAKSAVCKVVPERWGVLSALQICLFISSLEELECAVPHIGTLEPSTGIWFLNDVKRLERFISRLESVKCVSLSLAARRQGHAFLSLKNEGEFRAWASHVGNLLNCIVQRGCTSLTILDGSIEPDRPSLLHRMVRRLIPRGSHDMPSQMPPFPNVGPLHLTTLLIDSATLMVSPGIDWVLAALRQAPITTLCLSVARCDESTWSVVLPRFAVAAPGLTCLVLTQIDDTVQPVVLSVLPHFAQLTDLHIDLLHPFTLRGPHPLCPPLAAAPTLRHLRELRAPAELAKHFLSSEGALPELLVLFVLWLAPPGLNLDPLLALLAPIAAALLAHPRSPRLTLSIDACAGFTAADVVAGDVSANLLVDDGGQIAEGCARVERIDLDLDLDVDDHRGKAADDVVGVALLLAFFPNVKSVSLRARPEFSVTRLVQNIPPTASLMEIELNGKMHQLQ